VETVHRHDDAVRDLGREPNREPRLACAWRTGDAERCAFPIGRQRGRSRNQL
jgi:hypothetical protein